MRIRSVSVRRTARGGGAPAALHVPGQRNVLPKTIAKCGVMSPGRASRRSNAPIPSVVACREGIRPSQSPVWDFW